MDFLLVKRGLYYRPSAQGYTGIKEEAGLFSESDADPSEGVTAIPFETAPEIAPNCCSSVAFHYMTTKLKSLRKATESLHDQIALLTEERAEAERGMVKARAELNEVRCDALLWEASCSDGEHSHLLLKVWKRCKDAEFKLSKETKHIERLKGVLLPFATYGAVWMKASPNDESEYTKANDGTIIFHHGREPAFTVGHFRAANKVVKYVDEYR